MKSLVTLLLALMLFASCHLTPSSDKIVYPTSDTTKSDSTSRSSRREFQHPFDTNRKAILGDTYTDTVLFAGANYDSDYWYMLGVKGTDTAHLILMDVVNYSFGDLLEVKWKVDSIWIAGDGETLDFSEWLVAVKKLENPNLTSTVPTKSFPISDSTNFDNFEKSGKPDSEFPTRIGFQTNDPEISDRRLNYKVPFCKGFDAFVVTYRKGEHEVFATLITVDRQGKIIDTLNIAYDEIAESAFQTTSVIYKDKIVLTRWNWMTNDAPEKDIDVYDVQNNGKFLKKK